jgi:uncharacterized membrane protein YhaH (DUF805 family)
MDWRHLFFNFDGRISRRPYWIAMLVLFIVDLFPFWVSYGAGNERLGAILDLALLYPCLAVMVKRAHDRETSLLPVVAFVGLDAILNAFSFFGLAGPIDNTSGLYALFAFPCLALAFYLAIELGFRKGVSGPNRHGPDPLQGQT